jgi:flagellar hook-basal body complex protein FliE
MMPISELANAAKGIGSSFVGDQSSKATGAPFSSLLQSMVSQNQDLDQKAANAVTGLLTGQGVDVHDALIATQKASLAFELSLQIRNKAVAAYQQMMGMQF